MTNPDPNTRKRVQSSDLAGLNIRVKHALTQQPPFLNPHVWFLPSQWKALKKKNKQKKPFHFTHTPRRENLFSFSAFQLQVGGQRMRLDGFARVPAKGGEETARWTETEKRVIIRTSSLVIGKPAFGGALS